MVGWDQIQRVLPFSIVMDREGRIVSLGRSLRFAENALVGELIFDQMSLRRMPFERVADLSSLLERGVLGELKVCSYPLMGAFYEIDDRFCFVGTPRLEDVEMLTRSGLTISDFAPHDGVVSHLFSLQNLAVARKEEREAVQRSRFIQSQILDAAHRARQLVLVINRQGVITYANPEAVDRLQISSGIGEISLISMMDEESRRRVRRRGQALDWSAFNEGALVTLEAGAERADFAGYFVELGSDGEGTDWACLLRDVRDVDRAQREQLHVERASRMQAMARLSGEVAHEFNNILAVIISSVDFMLSSGKLEELGLTEDADLILAGASRGASLASRLLEVSSRPRSLARQLDLGDKLEEMLPGLESMASGCAIQLVVDSGEHRVSIEPRRLEQIVTNLVSNALDATAGPGIVRIELVSEPHDRRCRLVVEDHGVGMPPEDVDRMFDPLFSTKGRAGGVGIGLSTVFANVHEAEGSIYVDSEPGQGTRIEVAFPISELPQAVRSRSRSNETAAPGRPIHGRSIVVVEDNEGLRGAMVRILSGQGAEVAAFADTDSARREMSARAASVDLLVTDVLLDGENGLDYAREVWHEGRVDAVLVITGKADMDEVYRTLNQYGWDLLLKPFRNADFVEAVSRSLGREQTEASMDEGTSA